MGTATGERSNRRGVGRSPHGVQPQNGVWYHFAAEPDTPEALALVARLPDPIPWPDGLAPAPVTIDPQPLDTDPLPTADVLVVTYTVAEGEALADVLAPGQPTTSWIRYRNGWAELKKSVQPGAPSLARDQAGCGP